MSDEATVIPLENFKETMINATPDELKQVSAWLQECGGIDAQRCEMDEDKPPVSFDKPPFPLEVKKAGSAAAGTVTTEPGSAETVTSTPVKPGDDIIQRARELALESAVKSPTQPVFDSEAYWIGSNFHRNRALDMSGVEMLRKTLAAGYDVGAWTYNPQMETTAQLLMDRISAGYNRKAGMLDIEVKPRSAKTAAFHAVLRKMTWRLSKMGMAFEVWCSIGLSVVTGPWEERHD